MKKFLSLLLVILLICGVCLSAGACSGAGDGRKKIVVTIFPMYDWVMNVLGDRAEEFSVTLLLDSGADLHSFNPSVADMVAVAEADLFLYVGGESDKWVPDALKNVKNKNIRTMNLLSLLGDRAKAEEYVEGMEREEEEEEDEEEVEYDEHVWLSLKNAAYYSELIEREIAAVDSDHAETYAANAAAYKASLTALDGRYEATVAASPRDTILFGDRFPFRYLTEDYGLTYYAAFQGCSADAEASFATIAFLAEKVKDLGLPAVLALEKSDHKLAETIITASGVEDVRILTMDSMQAVTPEDRKNGASYLDSMEKNLETLREALN